MSRRRIAAPLLACAAIAAPILSGCGGGGGNGNVDVGPAAAVPANTPIYLDATVKPTGTAEADAKAAASKIMGTPDPGAKLISLFNKSAKRNTKPGQTFTWQQDVDPWLGNQIGMFFTSFAPNSDPTIVFESTDPAAALASRRKDTRDLGPGGSYKGHPYDKQSNGRVFGTIGNFAVYGPLQGFQQAVDATEGDSLGDSSDFKDAIGDLPTARLGTFYAIPKNVLDALPVSQLSPSFRQVIESAGGDSLDKPFAGALSASASSIQLDFTGGGNGVETPESSLIGSVPAQSWLAIGDGNLGATIKQAIDQAKAANPSVETVLNQIQSTSGATIDQLTGALGNAVLYVEGTTKSTLTGAFIVESKDPSLTTRLLTQLQAFAQIGGGGGVKPLSLSGGGTGFQAVVPNIPRPIEIAQQGGKLVLGYGAGSVEQALKPVQTLDSAQSFSAAKGQVSSLGTDFFLSFPQIFQLAESNGAKKDPGYVRAKPYLDALDYLVSGSGTKDDKTEVKAVLGLK